MQTGGGTSTITCPRIGTADVDFEPGSGKHQITPGEEIDRQFEFQHGVRFSTTRNASVRLVKVGSDVGAGLFLNIISRVRLLRKRLTRIKTLHPYRVDTKLSSRKGQSSLRLRRSGSGAGLVRAVFGS